MILQNAKKLLNALVMIAMLCATAAFAQQPQPTKEKEKESNYVDFSGFKGKIFELKNRDPRDLVSILSPLGSGFKGAILQANSEMKTLTVRDFPENIAVMEEALKRLDIPLPAPAKKDQVISSVEMRLHALLAYNEPLPSNVSADNDAKKEKDSATTKTTFPSELNEVIKQLQQTINYKNYYLLTSIVQNSTVYSNVQSEGTVSVGMPLFYQNLMPTYRLLIKDFSPNFYKPESPIIKISGFQFELTENSFGRIAIRNDVSIREGEKLVVGTASLKDKALILVLSVKVIK